MEHLAWAVAFVGFFSLISWWHGRPNLEERFDPIKAANEERDAVIKDRDDALRAWAEMGTKHERAIEKIVNLEDEASRNFKDLPYLTQRNYELSNENIVQYNEIQRLEIIKQQYDDLMRDVSAYGMTAKRPEKDQREYESLQRRLEISNCHLQKVEETAKVLKDMLKTQKETADKEKDWLRAMLKKNARSSAYWAKFRRSDDSKLAWGVRCACTEPETAYSLIDQTQKIVELEGIIATTKIPSHDQNISDSRKDLVNVRKIATEREKELEQQKTRIDELEANQSRLEDIINHKNVEIQELEAANQEMAEEPAQESAETLQRLTMANTHLKDLRHRYAEREGQSETQSARINELEATQRELEGRIEQKDAEITTANINLQESRQQHAGCQGQSETHSARINEL